MFHIGYKLCIRQNLALVFIIHFQFFYQPIKIRFNVLSFVKLGVLSFSMSVGLLLVIADLTCNPRVYKTLPPLLYTHLLSQYFHSNHSIQD